GTCSWCSLFIRRGSRNDSDRRNRGTTCFPSASQHRGIQAGPLRTLRGWKALRKTAGVQCRLHDLRHTAATKMAEAGVPESTMLALMGHMSRAMLERYSHIRMAAKRTAMDSLI